jgi:hypothetical protein
VAAVGDAILSLVLPAEPVAVRELEPVRVRAGVRLAFVELLGLLAFYVGRE